MEEVASSSGIPKGLMSQILQSSHDSVEVLTLLDKIRSIMGLKQNVLDYALKQFEKRRYNDRQFVLESFDNTLE